MSVQVCRGGEIVLSGWSQSRTLLGGLQWEVEGSVTLYPGQVLSTKQGARDDTALVRR